MADMPAHPIQKKFGRDLVIRTASAVILAPLAIWAVWTGEWPYLVLVSSVLFIGLYEWVRLAGAGTLAVIGVLYLGLNLIALIWLRSQPEIGRDLTFFLLLSVWAVDTGAYFAGRLIGGPKLAPRFSPAKTWAGLFGGMAAAAAIGLLWAFIAGARQPQWALLLGPVIAVIAQTGDIMESALKRRAGAKDSGTLIPGHGGILDRIDGLLLAAPFFALYQFCLGLKLGWW